MTNSCDVQNRKYGRIKATHSNKSAILIIIGIIERERERETRRGQVMKKRKDREQKLQ